MGITNINKYMLKENKMLKSSHPIICKDTYGRQPHAFARKESNWSLYRG